MASTVTSREHTGDGSDKTWAYTFQSYQEEDIKVAITNADGLFKNVTNFTIPNYSTASGTVTFNNTGVDTDVCESDGSPKNGRTIRIFRETDITTGSVGEVDPKATYTAGSAVKAGDLNNNARQALYAAFEQRDQEIQRADIRNDSIDGTKIADNAIDSEHYVDGSIDLAHMSANSVDSDQYVDGSIDLAHMSANSVDSAQYVDGSIDLVHMSANSVDSDQYVDGSIDTAHIADLQVTGAKIANDTITNGKIVNQTISNSKLVPNSITASELAANSVTASELADNAVDTAAIVADAVTRAKIGDDEINSEHYADNSINTAHIAGLQITTAKIADDAVTNDKILNRTIANSKLVLNSITASELADNAVSTAEIADDAVTVAKIADAELKTLSGMQSGTASVLAGGTALTSTITELNLLDGKSIVTTISASPTDVQIPTAQAVDERITTVVTDVGGFVPIANETSFPATNPDVDNGAGTIVSIKALANAITTGNTTNAIITNGAGTGNNVTIGGLTANTTYPAGRGMLVETTSTLHTYNYHRLTLDESGVADAQAAIDDFQARYRIHSGEPTGSLDDGDLVWDTNANKMKVYDATASAWTEITAAADFKILFLCPENGSGAPTINGSIARYDLREGSNTGATASIVNAAQLVVSVNGVIQKANAGTSAPTEGFAVVDSNTIIFGSNLPSNASVFVHQIGSAVSIPTPGDDTVSTAKIQNSAVTNAKIGTAAVSAAKIATGAVENAKIGAAAVSASKLATNAVETAKIADDAVTSAKIADASVDEARLNISNSPTNGQFLSAQSGNTGGLTWATVDLTAATDYADNTKVRFGTGNDLEIFHDGSDSYIKDVGTGNLFVLSSQFEAMNAAGNAYMLRCIEGASVELFEDGTKKLETTSTGVTVSGDLTVTSTSPGIWFTDTNSDPDWRILNLDGTLGVYDHTNSRYALQFEGDADVLIPTDAGKLKLGASQDLEIFHNGSHSFIKDVGTGNLAICGSIVALHASDATENMIVCSENGAVQLYYDNVKKFETTTTGATITGSLDFPDGYEARFGTGNDLTISHDGSNSYTLHGNTGNYLIKSGNSIYLRANGDENGIDIVKNAEVKLYYNSLERLKTNTAGVTITTAGATGQVHVRNPDTNGDARLYIQAGEGAEAYILLYADDGDNQTDKWKIVSPDGGPFKIQYDAGSWETSIECNRDGSTELFHNNSKKLATKSSGVTVTGELEATTLNCNGNAHIDGTLEVTSHLYLSDNDKAYFGTGDDLEIYHSANAQKENIFKCNNSSRFRINGNIASDYLCHFHNDGNNNNRHGVSIMNGADGTSGTHYALRFAAGNNTEAGVITHADGTVSYGNFTAHHPCIVPDADNLSNGTAVYPYGTLLETISIEYTKDAVSGEDTGRGIKYNVQKTQSANSKKVLGAYGGSMVGNGTGNTNLHQALVLGDGHILCNNAGGNIEVGDGICSSSTAGIGQKATVNPSMIIGIAQEAVTFTGSETKLVTVQYGLKQFIPWA